MGFTVFKFQPRIDAGIRALGFTAPTPIQAKAIPPILAGRDVLGLAQTGTGKTAAFVLPILERLIDGPRRTLRALVLAPTRELAEQIHDVIHLLTPHTGIRSATIYGGVGMQPQVEKLRNGVDIVVACPGRLLDHFSQRTINVSKLEVLVIDEADRMFDMGFLKDLRKVIAYLPKKRQTLLFSATMAEEIRRLIHDVLVEPETVQIGHSAPAATVDHALYPVPQHLKTPLLIELLKKTGPGSVLVFTRTKHRAKKVARTLAREGFSSAELQGNLSQNQRQNALDGFRDGRYRVLVATDIAARGIDVSTISHVINYDIPDTTDAYTHRIGRTGRMERGGDAFTFVTGEDQDTVRAIERVLKAPIERRTLEGFDYNQSAPKKDTEFARDPRPSRHAPHGHAKPKTHAHPSHARPHAHAATPSHAKPTHGRPHAHSGPAATTHATHGRSHAPGAARTGGGWKSGPGTAAAKPRGRRLLKRSGR
jgi:ATP-dependent RNA helicase RhlE